MGDLAQALANLEEKKVYELIDQKDRGRGKPPGHDKRM